MIRDNHVGVFVPALFLRERVVFVNIRVSETVQIKIDKRQAHHVGRYVVTIDVFRKAQAFVDCERVLPMSVGIGAKDMLICRNQEASRSTCRIV